MKSFVVGMLFWIAYSSSLLVLSETKFSRYLDLFKFLKFGVALSLLYVSGSFARGLFSKKQNAPEEEKQKDEDNSSKEQEEILQNNSTQPEEIHTLAPLPSIQGSSIIEQIRDVD